MRYVNFPDAFWIVTYPLKNDDTISEIMIKSDLKEFIKMVSNSELTFDEIYGIYGKGQNAKAKSDAQALLKQLEKGEISPYGIKDE